MTELCRRTRQAFACDAALAEGELALHLDGCDGCRTEVEALGRVIAALREDAAPATSESLDRRIHEWIEQTPALRPLLRPVFAAAMAVAALFAIVGALAVALAEAGAAEDGVRLALSLASAYLGLSATIALPLLLARARVAPEGALPR